MTAIVIIPARYDSTRFPGKPLASLNGKPIIQHVYENSKKSKLAKKVIVATDSDAIFETVRGFKGKAVMTSASHASGTDRIAEVAASLDYDIIVNVQGDEPLIRPEMIDDVIKLLEDKRAAMGTLIKKIETPEEIFDPNVVKAVFDKDGFAMYFSRAPIPFNRDHFCAEVQKRGSAEATPPYSSPYQGEDRRGITSRLLASGESLRRPNFLTSGLLMFKHIGIYSYRRSALLKLARTEPAPLELAEKLEQLRALTNGFKIKVKETLFETVGVDTPQDLERVKKWLSLSS